MAVIENIRLDGNYLWIDLLTQNIAKVSRPGQFVNVRAGETLDPLLRRPLSVCDADGDRLKLLVLIKGKGTKQLLNKKTGDTLNIIGPLGNGFPETTRKPLFVAGGIGVAPFLFLSKKYPEAELLLGARNSSLLPDLTLFKKSCRIETATDDGSAGIKGTVIDLAAKRSLDKYTIFACGPNPMFHALTRLLKNCPEADAYFSIETMMGCGFGACKGCSVSAKDGQFKLACTDGPVFRWDEVLP